MARSGQGVREPPQAVVAEGSGSLAPRPTSSGLALEDDMGVGRAGAGGSYAAQPPLLSDGGRGRDRSRVAAAGRPAEPGQHVHCPSAAWDHRQMQRLERQAQRQARAVKGSAQMARSGPPRGLAGTSHET